MSEINKKKRSIEQIEQTHLEIISTSSSSLFIPSKKTRIIVNSHNKQDIASFNNDDLGNNLNAECSPTNKERIQKQSFETEKNAVELATKIGAEGILISSASYTTKDANINKNHKLFKVNYSDELDYNLSPLKTINTAENENDLNLSSENDDKIKNQFQQIDTEQLEKT
ncbi:800_t:CDS:1, partial [Ambispora gerdemannii]